MLNNFQQPADGTALPQLRLMSTMFQGLFPPIQVEKSALPTFRRVLLISYNHGTGLVSMRHYTISVRPQGVSRRVRRLLDPSKSSTKRTNLSNADDIADYLLRRRGSSPGSDVTGGYDSMSESEASEAESDSNAVELPEDYVGRGNKKGERKAVKLLETGPRLELKLVKVVEGLVGSKKGEGQTVFHEFVSKSSKESAAQQKRHDQQRQLKAARRAEQAANVARKKAEKAAKKGEVVEEEEESDVDVEGLSDLDPEEELERMRAQQRDDDDDEDEDGFDYEDHGAEGDEEEDLDWDENEAVGEVSEEGESSDDDEPQPEPVKRSKRKN